MKDPRQYYKHGDWNAICDVCGFKFKASELRRRWDGMRVCSADFERRHPQDLLRGRKDDPSVPWTRPDVKAMQVIVNPLDPDDVTYVDILGNAYIVIGNQLVFIGPAAARIGGDNLTLLDDSPVAPTGPSTDQGMPDDLEMTDDLEMI